MRKIASLSTPEEVARQILDGAEVTCFRRAIAKYSLEVEKLIFPYHYVDEDMEKYVQLAIYTKKETEEQVEVAPWQLLELAKEEEGEVMLDLFKFSDEDELPLEERLVITDLLSLFSPEVTREDIKFVSVWGGLPTLVATLALAKKKTTLFFLVDFITTSNHSRE